jgi:FtsZ-interacting cell division protein ZipA
MALYFFAGLSLLLLLVCGICLGAILKTVRWQEHHEKHSHFLELALRESGQWDDYQRAFRRSWELWGEADNEPRAKAKAKAEAEASARVDAEDRAARGKATAAEARATPEAQAKIAARSVKASNTAQSRQP